MHLPRARTTDILVQSAGKELLVYDLTTNKAYNLNETAAIVFNHFDGTHTVDELKAKHNYTEDLIFLALDELKRNNLITGEVINHFPNMTRREAAKRVGLTTIIALPLISGLIAPLAAHAQSANSNSGNVCITNSCADGINGCNPDDSRGCTALGLVCCFASGICNCTAINTCRDNGGTICSATA